MNGRVKLICSGLAAMVMLAVWTHTIEAQVIVNKNHRKCLETIAKEGGKYVKARLKELAKCADKNLKNTATCDVAKRNAKLDKAETSLRTKIDKGCGDASKLPDPDAALELIGFPGKCPDTTGPPFTNDDLEECIFSSHRDAADSLFGLQYGTNGNVANPNSVSSFAAQGNDNATAKLLQKCQKEIGKNNLKFALVILKEIQKCRNGLQKGKLTGFLPTECANNPIYTKPKEKIDKAETKTRQKIQGKCTDAELALMDVCDSGGGPVTTIGPALDCLVNTHRDATDNADLGAPADLIDIEYRATAICGDNIKNERPLNAFGLFFYGDPPEECDGTDTTQCPGFCGAPGSQFPCLCTNIPRMRVVERAGLDGDNGWNGVSHDQIMPGGSHLVDLYDCDGPAGPDTICTIGPSCSTDPHYPCVFPTPTVGQLGYSPALVGDAACTAHGQGTCRKRATAVGPHCNNDIQKSCDVNSDCTTGNGDFCRKTLAQTPISTSGGGVTVCTVNILTEDVVGTIDVASGASSIRLRQNAKTKLATGSAIQPCPLCGGFCANAIADQNLRTPCSADSDCPASVTCVTSHICSFGPNADLACRTDPPVGGTTAAFGTTSRDCPPPIGGAFNLDITTDPRTTGNLTMLPSATCSNQVFADKACIFGTDIGKTCTVDGDCPAGGTDSCTPRCFCDLPHISQSQAPNACLNACRNSTNEYAACNADSECPGGFCQSASCRLAQGVCLTGTNRLGTCTVDSECPGASPGGACGDHTSSQEGFCPQRPALDTFCSVHTFRECFNDDLFCRPASAGGNCSFCEETEVCHSKSRQCFLNEGIVRMGALGLTPLPGADLAHTRASVFCIPAGGNPSVEIGGGFPGPGTTEGDEDIYLTGF